MLKGGVIMDVMNVEQAKIAEQAGAVAIMALERIPSDIRSSNQVARMSAPEMISEIQNAVSIPVMAKCRIGHFVEAQILATLEIDYIDESEVLSMADDDNHINKRDSEFFANVPFVCGARNLAEAMRRIQEGAAMIRTKGEAGTGNIIEAVRHARCISNEISKIKTMNQLQLWKYAKTTSSPIHLIEEIHRLGRLPVVNFAAGGIATPADAALMMQLGCDGVFVGSGIFNSENPLLRAKAIVQAVTYYKNPKVITKVSTDLGRAMPGISDLSNKGGNHVQFRYRGDSKCNKNSIDNVNDEESEAPTNTWNN